jgi:hypothetical protein
MTTDPYDDAACVDEWRRRLGDHLDPAELTRAFERAFRLVWNAAQLTLGDVTLAAIADRVLFDAAEAHPLLGSVRLDAAGISCEELERKAAALDRGDLEKAMRTMLVSLLEVLGRLTAGVLTPLLHAALSDDRDEESAT